MCPQNVIAWHETCKGWAHLRLFLNLCLKNDVGDGLENWPQVAFPLPETTQVGKGHSIASIIQLANLILPVPALPFKIFWGGPLLSLTGG